MASILDSVDSRTQLVGENRLELLTFHLNGQQLFAINVFKVQEVVSLPKLTLIPQRHPVVCGITHFRGQTIAVIDLSLAVGRRPLDRSSHSNIVVTEYNGTVQAFLVGGVDRIVNLNWEEILPPPSGTGRAHYLTAITRLDNKIVEIIDVEKVLSQVMPYQTHADEELIDSSIKDSAQQMSVLLVDDSPTAIAQASEILAQIGVQVITASDGLKALTLLKNWADEGLNLNDKLLMVITDAEMPEMDGYRLTSEIRSDPRLASLHVVLHTSLSGAFNQAMVKKVGCDGFLSKFQPNVLAELVQERIKSVL